MATRANDTPESGARRTVTKGETRKTIAAATAMLVNELGYRDTTIELIAERAGVSSRTFFRHFPSKESALFAFEESWAEVLADALDASDPELPIFEGLLSGIRAVMGEVEKDRALLLDMSRLADSVAAVRAHLVHDIGTQLKEVVASWAERRLGVPAVIDPRPLLLAGMAQAIARSTIYRWLAHHGSRPVLDLLDETDEALLDLVRHASDSSLARRDHHQA